MTMLIPIAAFAAAYLLGSINSAVMISKAFFGDDVRNHGSGNAGTTNMLRTFGARAGAFTFISDILKGVISVWLAKLFCQWAGFEGQSVYAAYVAGFGAVIGHMFPLYFRFRGGKGVATGLGAVFAINTAIFGIIFPVGVALAAISGYVSLGSLCGAVMFPFFVAWSSYRGGGAVDYIELTLAALLALLIIYNHRENIKRLLSGTENKFYKKK